MSGLPTRGQKTRSNFRPNKKKQELKRRQRKMKRKHKTYSKPKRPFDKVRIDEEAEIKKNLD